jgi:hypothetical protein
MLVRISSCYICLDEIRLMSSYVGLGQVMSGLDRLGPDISGCQVRSVNSML